MFLYFSYEKFNSLNVSNLLYFVGMKLNLLTKCTKCLRNRKSHRLTCCQVSNWNRFLCIGG